jgi:cytochrome c-type biogenesis protein CcmH/NrfG
MVTLAVVVIVFGIHSTVDWTWFVPANAGVALLCAGWVVGRGPLRARLAHPAGAAPPPSAWPYASRLARIGNSVPPLHGVAAALALVLALAAAWTAYQPVRSVHASDTAYERLDQGQPAAAADIARIATRRDPLSADPLFDLAAIDQAQGDLRGAENALGRAVRLEPATAEAWRRLGDFRLTALHDAKGAVSAYQAAYYLDPHNPASTTDLLTASRAEQGTATGAAPTP